MPNGGKHAGPEDLGARKELPEQTISVSLVCNDGRAEPVVWHREFKIHETNAVTALTEHIARGYLSPGYELVVTHRMRERTEETHES